MNTQKEVRTAFWNAHPQHTKKAGTKPNEYSTDIRVNFSDYLDFLQKDGQITANLYHKVTL
jgi:hypothetical protein